jgi:hypothetical protein
VTPDAVYLAGTSFTQGPAEYPEYPFVAALDRATLTPLPGFGDHGVVRIGDGTGDVVAQDLALTPDGVFEAAVIRPEAGGTPPGAVHGFDLKTGAPLAEPTAFGFSLAVSLAADATGRLWAASGTGDGVRLERFSSTGVHEDAFTRTVSGPKVFTNRLRLVAVADGVAITGDAYRGPDGTGAPKTSAFAILLDGTGAELGRRTTRRRSTSTGFVALPDGRLLQALGRSEDGLRRVLPHQIPPQLRVFTGMG